MPDKCVNRAGENAAPQGSVCPKRSEQMLTDSVELIQMTGNQEVNCGYQRRYTVGNGGEGGINIHRLRFAINNGKFLL
jgi:hypothetical protein